MKVSSRTYHPSKMSKFQKELKCLYHLDELGHGLVSPVSLCDGVASEVYTPRRGCDYVS